MSGLDVSYGSDCVAKLRPKAVEPKNAFHVGKPHLDLLLAARLLEGFRMQTLSRTHTLNARSELAS